MPVSAVLVCFGAAALHQGWAEEDTIWGRGAPRRAEVVDAGFVDVLNALDMLFSADATMKYSGRED